MAVLQCRRANEATTLVLLVSAVLGVASNVVALVAVGPYFALFMVAYSDTAVALMLVGGLPGPILTLLAASDQMRSFGAGAMRVMAASFVFGGASTVAATYEQATDRVGRSMAIQLLRQGALSLAMELCGWR